ncbi:MAG: hypothetical protein AAGG02_06895 [Cyanobacteria bacterium P01_H01_bin.15]
MEIEELLDIFRGGLMALIPTMEHAKIPWQQAENYDDWDAIAETLYEQIVIDALREIYSLDYEVKFADMTYTPGSTRVLQSLRFH